MSSRIFAQSHGSLSVAHVGNSDEAELLTRSLRLRKLCSHLVVVIGKFCHEVVDGDARISKRLWHEALDGNVVELDHHTSLTRERHHLSRNVRSIQILARIGLGVPVVASLLDDVGELHVRRPRVEDVRERSTEDALHLLDAVSCFHETPERGDDWQARTHSALAQVVRVALSLQPAHLVVARQRAAVHLFVGSHDVDASLQPLDIEVRNLVACRAVDDDGVGNAVGVVAKVVRKGVHVNRLGIVRVLILPSVEVNANVARRQHHLAASGNGNDTKVDVELVEQLLLLLVDLAKQHLANQTRSHETNRERRLGQEEARVRGSQGAHGVIRLDHHGQVVLA
mmetsp:Transcript_12594/g.33506  ORF Transcript_12594/g.33506 Transcript_12594/m.33506 type:complete len:340 (-) Transcript_12594:1736-2755(-)